MGSKVLGVLFALLVIAVYQSAQAQRSPMISYISPEQNSDIGSTVEFQCSVQHSQDYPVLWLKYNKNRDDEFIISTNTALVTRDNRYDVRSDASSSTYTLQIKDIQETDAGHYECQILISMSRRISAAVELQVRRPPIISDNSTRAVVVNEGQPDKLEDQSTAQGQTTPKISYISPEQIKEIGSTVELQCSVQYSQDYPVLWVKYNKNRDDEFPISTNNALITRDSRYDLISDPSSSTFTLQIKDIQETDAGHYECQIFTSRSTRISAAVELQVRRPPIISDNSTRAVVVNEGQSVQLEDQSTGNTLKIASVRKEDPENGVVGRGAQRNINLEVEFAPVITTTRPRLGQALQYDEESQNI